MFINKVGSYHLENGINCQDFGFISNNGLRKCITDGCTGAIHSEVGAKLFCHWRKDDVPVDLIFDKLVSLFPLCKDALDYCSFTYIESNEFETEWRVDYVGDGFIIKETIDGDIEFENLTNGTDYPDYIIYNYIPNDYFKNFDRIITTKTKTFSKDKYKNIGISSDGIQFLLDSPLKSDFVNLLKTNKETQMKRFLNKHNGTTFISMGETLTPKDIINLGISKTAQDDIIIAF